MSASVPFLPRVRALAPTRRAPSRCVGAAILLPLVWGPLPLSAQDADPGAEAPVPSAAFHGQVLDHQTGEPVHRAEVYLPGQDVGFLTDLTGAFLLPDIPLGEHTVTVERLGYHPVEVRVTHGERPAPVHFRLLPDPVLLEGLDVVLDRFERRRRSVTTSVRVIPEGELRTSATSDMIMFLRARGLLQLRPCPGGGIQSFCVRSRGRVRRVAVCIDEWPAVGGMDELAGYDPQHFHTLEIYARGRQVRAYTHGFMERAAATRLMPIPLFF